MPDGPPPQAPPLPNEVPPTPAPTPDHTTQSIESDFEEGEISDEEKMSSSHVFESTTYEERIEMVGDILGAELPKLEKESKNFAFGLIPVGIVLPVGEPSHMIATGRHSKLRVS